jgi:hypothetical protein
MTITIVLILAILALLLTVASAAGWCPLWVPVILINICVLIPSIPLK